MSARRRRNSRAKRKTLLAQLRQALQDQRILHQQLAVFTRQITQQRDQLKEQLRASQVAHARELEQVQRDHLPFRHFHTRVARMLHATCLAHDIPDAQHATLRHVAHGGPFFERVFEPVAYPNKLTMADQAAIMVAKTEREAMNLLKMSVIEHSMTRQMHVRVQLKNGAAGYALSDTAIAMAPPEELAHHIADELVPFLVRELSRQQGRPDWDAGPWSDERRYCRTG